MPVEPLHLSRTHQPLHQLTAMAIRNSLIIIIIILVGSLLALPDIYSCLPVLRLTANLPQGRATSSRTSAPTKPAVRQYMAAPKSYQTEGGDIITCKVLMWKLFCRVRYIQKATTSIPTTTVTTVPRTTTSSPMKNTATTKKIYNRSRGILG